MSVESFILLVLLLFLSQLVLNSAQESKQGRDCTSPFNCGKFGNVSFPFSDIDNPKCGLSFLNCSGTELRVQFHNKGKWYPVSDYNPHGRTIVIHDQDLQNDLNSNRCNSLNNFTENVTPSLSIDVIETHPFFKCKKLKLHPIFGSEFFNKLFNYSGCENYDLYFYDNFKKSLPILPKNLSGYCSLVYLPYRYGTNGYEDYKLTTLWDAKFTIRWYVDLDCWKCHWKGGQCLTRSNGRFICVKGPKSIRKKIIIGTSVAIGGVLVTTLLVFCCRRFLKGNSILIWKRKKKPHRVMEEFLRNYGSLAPTRYNFSDIKKITHSFKDQIGQGGYGGVYKGKRLDGRLVAVKLLDKAKGDGEEFINEVASISRTSHVNIVSLVGFCFDGSKRALIYEFMANGSLEKFIHGHITLVAPSQLGWEKLYEIAIGVARGLEYLHRGCNTRILHFDIKPHNILLDKNFTPKISDFGLAKLCSREESIISMLGARGTIGYIAPEVISRNFGGVSHKSDVYSYGMMVLEIVGKRKNIDVGVDHTSEIYFPDWIYKRLELNQDLGLPGIISNAEEDIAKKLILVALWCIQTNPADRPAMSRVVEMLEARHETLQIPPKPYLSSPPRSHIQSSNRIRASLQTLLD